jgi:Translation initiation factor 1A / IF-1
MDFTFARATGGRAVFAVFASPDERVRRDQHHDGASGNHVPCRARKRSSGSEYISGKMRKRRFIRLTIGDRVKMQMSPYDTAKARIVYRL